MNVPFADCVGAGAHFNKKRLFKGRNLLLVGGFRFLHNLRFFLQTAAACNGKQETTVPNKFSRKGGEIYFRAQGETLKKNNNNK